MATKNYIYYTDQEDRDLLTYVAEYSKEADRPLVLGHLWMTYIEQSKTERSVKSLCSRFRDNLIPKMHEWTILGLDEKIRMLFATQYPVNEEMERQIAASGYLELNSDRCIVTYKSHEENGLELSLVDKNGRVFRKSGRNLLGPNQVRKRKRNSNFANPNNPLLMNNDYHNLHQYQDIDFYYPMDPEDHEDSGDHEEGFHLNREIKSEYQDVPTSSMGSSLSTVKAQSSTTSLKDFLKLLKTVVVSFEATELGELRQNVANAIGELGDSDKQIPLNKIRLALETTLALVNG